MSKIADYIDTLHEHTIRFRVILSAAKDLLPKKHVILSEQSDSKDLLS